MKAAGQVRPAFLMGALTQMKSRLNAGGLEYSVLPVMSLGQEVSDMRQIIGRFIINAMAFVFVHITGAVQKLHQIA